MLYLYCGECPAEGRYTTDIMPVIEEAHPLAKESSKVFPGLLKTARSWNGEVTIVRVGEGSPANV
jgi:hypothetical protein